jgi:ADP-dependent NAD(P)H-hydrate dehydratase / NAD(P)H-hydrate epimerase
MEYWHKQSIEKPLYENMLWARPETKAQSGKLLIVGGNLHGFAAPASAYSESIKAGIGVARVVLPDALKKTVGRFMENTDFTPSTPSGSFSQASLGGLLDAASWSDGVLLSGDLGRNSETAIVLEKFLDKYKGPATLSKDAADYVIALAEKTAGRQNTILVVSVAQLQKFAVAVKFHQPFKFGMDLTQLIRNLHEFTKLHEVSIVIKHGENIVAAYQGQVCTIKVIPDREVWRVQVAAYAAVWQLQNPNKPFEALSLAIHQFASSVSQG